MGLAIGKISLKISNCLAKFSNFAHFDSVCISLLLWHQNLILKKATFDKYFIKLRPELHFKMTTLYN